MDGFQPRAIQSRFERFHAFMHRTVLRNKRTGLTRGLRLTGLVGLYSPVPYGLVRM